MRPNWGKIGLWAAAATVTLPFLHPGVRLRLETFFEVARAHNYLHKIAVSEKRHHTAFGRYASLDELVTGGEVSKPSGLFEYHVESYGDQFVAVATYTGLSARAPRTITIDEDLTVQEHYATPDTPAR